MNVKELKESIDNALKRGDIEETDEVIISGEYGFGMPILRAYTDKLAETEEEILRENINALVLDVPTYLYESEDVGYCRMFMDMDSLNDHYREFFEGEEE